MNIDGEVVRLAKRIALEFRKLKALPLDLKSLIARVEALEQRETEPVEEAEDGESATVTIGTVTTGAPGSPATVTNIGTPTTVILDFSIPAGTSGTTNTTFTTGELATLPDCGVISSAMAHGIAGGPSLIIGQFACTSADLSYAVGDVIPLSAVKQDSAAGSADHGDSFTPVFDTTNIFLIGATGAVAAVRQAPDKGTGMVGTLDPTKWKFLWVAVKYT